MTAVRLLALDIDGTLLTDDGTMAVVDRAAIARARSAGVQVTIATGRLPSAALPIAEELGLTLPIVCCDGAVTVCPRTHMDLHTVGLDAEAAAASIALLTRYGTSPFLLTPGGVVSPASAPEGIAVLAVLGASSEQRARAAHDSLAAGAIAGVESSLFVVEGQGRWAVRVGPVGVDKASGLARLARQLGVAAGDVAVVGDWYNDVPMFAWAGHSFAMGHAPLAVARAARHSLRATAERGGGIAEAIDQMSADARMAADATRPVIATHRSVTSA